MTFTVLLQLLIGFLSLGLSANVALHATALDRAVPSLVSPILSVHTVDGKDSNTSLHSLVSDTHPHHELKLTGDMFKNLNKDEPRATSRNTKKVYVAKELHIASHHRNPFLYPLD